MSSVHLAATVRTVRVELWRASTSTNFPRREMMNANTIIKTNNLRADGEYYANGDFETIDYIENLMCSLITNGVNPKVAYDVAAAIKYLSTRLGSKIDAPIELDLLKAENYIHRARTGEWIPKELLTIDGGV